MIDNINYMEKNHPRLLGLIGLLPEHMRSAAIGYIAAGEGPHGTFFTSFLKNDFLGMVSSADQSNLSRMVEYGMLMYHMPVTSYGSQEAIDQWRKTGGLRNNEGKENHTETKGA